MKKTKSKNSLCIKTFRSISLIGANYESQVSNRPLSPNNKQNQERQPVVQIDRNCLSCASQPLKVISAFKMACLSYFPSLVHIEDSDFTRSQAIELKQKILNE
jgi:hypothetical protein